MGKAIPITIQRMIDAGALFFSNDSGGKDSQAMRIFLQSIIPPSNLIIIHANLPEVEWEGTIDFIRGNSAGHRVEVCQASKTFFQMVERRQMFPSKDYRQCTSDLKRGPLEKLVRSLSIEYENKLIVNCMGLRAQESKLRAGKRTVKKSKSNSVAGRTWIEWLPIHKWTEKKVFQTISDAGEKPFWTYGEGMKRKSCSFCIMGCLNDLRISARLRPDLFKKIVETEKRIGHTLMMPKGKPFTLDQYIGMEVGNV
jgi:DNA sulfur modification protein DndC